MCCRPLQSAKQPDISVLRALGTRGERAVMSASCTPQWPHRARDAAVLWGFALGTLLGRPNAISVGPQCSPLAHALAEAGAKEANFGHHHSRLGTQDRSQSFRWLGWAGAGRGAERAVCALADRALCGAGTCRR